MDPIDNSSFEINYDHYGTMDPNIPADGIHLPKRQPGDVAALIIYSVVFSVGVPGNASVVWVTAFEARRAVNAIWFSNSAVADLLSCLASPVSFTTVLNHNYWYFDATACIVSPSLISLNMYASISSSATISADRFSSVFKPIWCQKVRGTGSAWMACGVAWVLALLLTIPSFVYREAYKDFYSEHTVCGINYGGGSFPKEKAVAISRSMVGFVLPSLTLNICYTFLSLRTWSRKATRSTKTLKVVMAVVICFFIFWSPYQVTGVMIAWSPPSSPTLKRVEKSNSSCVSSAYINCCVNPIIYVMAGQGFHGRLLRSLPSIIRNALSEDSVGRDSKTFTPSTTDTSTRKSQAV